MSGAPSSPPSRQTLQHENAQSFPSPIREFAKRVIPDANIDTFRRLIKEDIHNADAHYNLGILYKSQNQRQEYIREINAALTIQPQVPKHHIELGIAMMEQKMHREAQMHFRNALKIDGRNTIALVNLCASLASEAKYTEALTPILEAAQCAPDSAMIHRNAAKVLQKLGRLKESAEHNKAALALEGGDAITSHTLAMQQASLKQSDVAVATYKQYRKLTGQQAKLAFY